MAGSKCAVSADSEKEAKVVKNPLTKEEKVA
jgi:hypothetical protein